MIISRLTALTMWLRWRPATHGTSRQDSRQPNPVFPVLGTTIWAILFSVSPTWQYPLVLSWSGLPLSQWHSRKFFPWTLKFWHLRNRLVEHFIAYRSSIWMSMGGPDSWPVYTAAFCVKWWYLRTRNAPLHWRTTGIDRPGGYSALRFLSCKGDTMIIGLIITNNTLLGVPGILPCIGSGLYGFSTAFLLLNSLFFWYSPTLRSVSYMTTCRNQVLC
jgi:hypothetical protein